MSNIKQKLTVAAVETSTTAAAAATAVAITAGSPAAAALAAIPIMAKMVVECLLDLGRATEARQARECQFTEEFKRQIEAIMRRLAEVSTEAERIKWRMLNYEEVLILVEQFFEQAMKSPLRERRSMLAAAAASSFRPDVTTEVKSRASRVIDQLEPSDVAALRRLVQVRDVAQLRSEFDGAMTDEPWISTSTLLRVGCLAERPFLEERESDYPPRAQARPPRLRMLTDITPLGREVLRLLETYTTDSNALRETD